MKLFKIKSLAFLLMAFALSFIIPQHSDAQTRKVTTSTVLQGNTVDFGGTYGNPSDSLQVSDSIAYFVPVSHLNDVSPYITWYWSNIGSGTATITETFLQSNDNINWFAVKAGVAQTAYSKTWTLSASGWNEISFQRDTAGFYGRYLKVYFITSATASVKGKLFNRMKVNIN